MSNDLPAINRNYVTFGCLNNFCKVNEQVLALWAMILKSVPESRLLILTDPGGHRDQVRKVLQGLGISAMRVEFAATCPHSQYLGLHHKIDIILDTFPYNGHTTSLDALWMGVPVVSLLGQTAVGRGGLSILSNIGLPELVAHTEEEYVKIAVDLANDLPRLAKLRETMRERMQVSPLMDAPRFARSIEDAYRTMWHQWCVSRNHHA
jgi:protein O-GlcNAc transferase